MRKEYIKIAFILLFIFSFWFTPSSPFLVKWLTQFKKFTSEQVYLLIDLVFLLLPVTLLPFTSFCYHSVIYPSPFSFLLSPSPYRSPLSFSPHPLSLPSLLSSLTSSDTKTSFHYGATPSSRLFSEVSSPNSSRSVRYSHAVRFSIWCRTLSFFGATRCGGCAARKSRTARR